MSVEMDVPDEVMTLGPDERCRWFANELILEHPKLDRASEELLGYLNPDHPAPMVVVHGPTGVGKTTLMHMTVRDYPWKDRAGEIPVIWFPIEAPMKGTYEFDDTHWRPMLEATSDPFVDQHFRASAAIDRRQDRLSRMDRIDPSVRDSYLTRPTNGRKPSAKDLQRAAERRLKLLKVGAVFLDEAQHMFKTSGARKLTDQMDVLKSFVDRTGVKQVLFGTEAIPDMRLLNSQLARRTKTVLFDAYDYTNDEDWDDFNVVFGQLVMSLPVRKQESLESCLDRVFESSSGCVGIVKDMLTSALCTALGAGDECVSPELLERECERMARDGSVELIAESVGQLRVNRMPEVRSRTRRLLGMPEESAGKKRRTKSKRTPLPGRCKPTNDPVGAASGP